MQAAQAAPLIADMAEDAAGARIEAVLIARPPRSRDQVVAAVVPETMPVWRVDFSDAAEDFATASGTVLALANRYDGIDLPDDACRLVVLAGLAGRRFASLINV